MPYNLPAIMQQLENLAPLLPAERVAAWCRHFNEMPFVADSCGEAPLNSAAGNPYIHFNQFDCVSFVNTVCALSAATAFPAFEEKYRQLRYHAQVNYPERNHFIEQWYRNNVTRKKIFSNITRRICGKEITKTLKLYFDGSLWLAGKLVHLPGVAEPAPELYKFVQKPAVLCLKTLFASAKNADPSENSFQTALDKLAARLQNGDVVIFQTEEMVHLGIVCQEEFPVMYTASSLKNKVTRFSFGRYIAMLYAMHFVTRLVFLRPNA